MRCFLVVQIIRRPHSSACGIVNWDINSNSNRGAAPPPAVLVIDDNCDDTVVLEPCALLVERPTEGRVGDTADAGVLLVLLEGGAGTPVEGSGLDGETNDLGGVVISPSGTW